MAMAPEGGLWGILMPLQAILEQGPDMVHAQEPSK
jgi:hypothetical protein